MSRDFPILRDPKERSAGAPPSIPWAMIAPHERQAWSNHGQSLERLAERGGLGTWEAIAVLEGKRWREVPVEGSIDRLKAKVAEWRASLQGLLEAFDPCI